MATRAQAKAAIDNACTSIKATIDLLPSGVDIVDGAIRFGPTRYSLTLAGTNLATATALATAVSDNFTAAAIVNTVEISLGRRKSDTSGRIIVRATPATIIISF